jgi:hypothetical protein
MKSFLLIPTFIFTAAFLSGCSSNDPFPLKEISTDYGKISQISLDKIPGEIKELKLSELIVDFKVIPLETKPECLISNTQIVFAKDFILVGTQNFPGAARLYQFDNDGKFIIEIGKPGKGPGEHIGYLADIIHCYEDNKTILVKWIGTSEKPQLFDYNGTLIKEIKQPYDLTRYIDKWSDSIWFSIGAFAGNIRMQRDSFALVFYNDVGKILNVIARREYPPKNLTGYTPSPWGHSLYKVDDHWRLFMGGNDTIFDIHNMKLIPAGVIIPDQNVLPFNKTIAPSDLPGKTSYNILSETENNWFLEKTIIKTAEVTEFRPGEWGGSFNTDRQLIIIDKKSKKAINAFLVDDIFNMLPSELLNGRLNWQNDRLYFALQTINLTKMIRESLKDKITNPEAIKIMDKLKTIPEDSNPVIFSFSIKDRIKIDE